VHLVKGNIGTGCLALPFCFSMLGSFWSVIVLGVSGSLCVYNMWLVVQCKRRLLGANTYGELGYAAFGRKGELTIESFLTMMQLSVCCVYFTFIGSNINSLTPSGGSLSAQKLIMALLVIPIALIAQLRSIRQLVPLSMTATILLVVALGLIFFICTITIISEPQPTQPIFDTTKLISFFSITIFAFEGND